MPDDSAILLLRARQKSRHIFKRHQRNVEAVAKAHEARALHRRIDIERARQHRRLIGHDPDRLPVEPRKSHHDVLGIVLVNFEKVAVIDNRVNHIFHVIRQVRLIGDERVELLVQPIDRIVAGLARRVFQIVRWNETQQFANRRQTLGIVAAHEVRHA